MKLLFCTECHDMFRLNLEERFCLCGLSSGFYLSDGLNAIIKGPCIPLGISNPSFIEAIKQRPKYGDGKIFEAFIIPEKCPTIEKKK